MTIQSSLGNLRSEVTTIDVVSKITFMLVYSYASLLQTPFIRSVIRGGNVLLIQMLVGTYPSALFQGARVPLYTEVSSFREVGIEELSCIQRCFQDVGIEGFHCIESFQGVGIEGFHCIESFQGVGIEGFHCIQRCPHFRVLE